jgi:threonine 3-dehydrogenase
MYAIFDPFGNATHTALSFDCLGEDVLIAGAGPIGCMAAAIVKFAGARHVVVTDFNQYRLDMAKKLGATRTINLNEEKLEEVMEKIGMQEGFDVGLEMSGSPAALNSMIHNMKHGGNIALLGLQETDTVVDLETVIFNGLNIKGIYGRKVWDTWYKMTTMLQAGLKIDDIITHHFDARDYEKGFQAMISGQSGKVILDWTHINEEKPE